jgi:SAM-dependent methyltransferase
MSLSHQSRRLVARLRGGGIRWLAGAIYDRVFPPRLAMRSAVLAACRERRGLEIGGPSRVFAPRGILPIYPTAEQIDNVNFAANTAWEHGLRDGGAFQFHPSRPPGRQWLREATSLAGIADGAFEFVLSSHCLEHLANPLEALREWRRVTAKTGHLVLIVPDPARSFDHRRPVTTLAHLRKDAADAVAESDATHIAEVLALHDLSRDPDAGSRENFEHRIAGNAANRCVHHHVFDLELLSAALRETGWRVLQFEKARPVHLCVLAQNDTP